MVDRLVLHIGTHKTGSTAIQSSLTDAHGWLLASGVLYPETGRMGPGHAFLASEVVGAPPNRPVHMRLVEEVRESRAPAVVLSSEVFSTPANAPASVSWAESLLAELQAGDATVLAYVRPQGPYIESIYVQRVRAGLVWAPFEEFLDRSLEQDDELDYPRRFAPWRTAFETGLQVRPYVAEALAGGDVVPDFWEVCGLGSPPETTSGPSNPRAGARTTEMLRALRAVLSDHGLEQVASPRRVLARARRRIEGELPGDRPFSGLTAELAGRVAERFAASNELLAREYLDDRHGEPFLRATAPAGGPGAWSLDEATDRERTVFERVVETSLTELQRLPEQR